MAKDVIIYAGADIQEIVARIRGYATAADLHLRDLQRSYDRLFASGWQDTEAVRMFNESHGRCMGLAEDVRLTLDRLGIEVDAAHVGFMDVDRSIAGEFV